MSQMKNIVSIATLPDTFEKEIAIYDLNEFLSAMSLFNDPDLKFGDNSVRIVEGGQSLKYFYSDPTVVTTPKSDITMYDFRCKVYSETRCIQSTCKSIICS